MSSPSCNLLIEPDGALSLTSTHDQVLSRYSFVGGAFPQAAVPAGAICEAALAIALACRDAGIIGHVGVDFVAFTGAEGMLRLWAVDLNLRLTPTALSFSFFDFLVGGAFDAATGEYRGGPSGENGQTTRTYVMSNAFYHAQLPSVRPSTFFSACRHRGASFDLVARTGTTRFHAFLLAGPFCSHNLGITSAVGTVFNLVDSFSGGVLGMLTVGPSRLDALRRFAETPDRRTYPMHFPSL